MAKDLHKRVSAALLAAVMTAAMAVAAPSAELTGVKGDVAKEITEFQPAGTAKSISADKPAIEVPLTTYAAEAGLTEEEAIYVTDIARSLQTPVGARGFESYDAEDEEISVIVQFDVLPAKLLEKYNALTRTVSVNSEETAKKALADFKKEVRSLSDLGASLKFGYDFHQVFNGVQVTLPASLVEELAALPGVYSVTPDYMRNITAEPSGIGMKESKELLGIDEIYDAGITGEGVKVGVLDTGIDYDHPDLKGVYQGGYDYIDNDLDPMETTYEDWLAANDEYGSPEIDPGSGSEYYTSHGTHVSGTIAGTGDNNSAYATRGIAPGVDLYVYRVLGPYGSGPSSGIIAAVDEAASAGEDDVTMDVINLSLGADINTAYAADVEALNNACIAGVTVVVSAGNNASGNGPRESLTLGTPGTAYLPITVAASRVGGGPDRIYQSARVTGSALIAESAPDLDRPLDILVAGSDMRKAVGGDDFSEYALEYTDELGYGIVPAFGAGSPPTATDYSDLEALGDDSLAGKILAVKRGIMSFDEMLSEAGRLNAGALYIINRDDVDDYITNMTISGEGLEKILILTSPPDAGVLLAEAADAFESVYLSPGVLTRKEQEKTPADFSSIGPVRETAGIKPDIIAPGWEIMSTQPAFIINPGHELEPYGYEYAYARMGGTSMSAPHIAGIAALAIQKFPDDPPAVIKARLMNTADPDFIKPYEGLTDGEEISVFEVGAGFVNPKRALLDDTDVYITVQDDIPALGEGDSMTVRSDQTLSSLSFGMIDGPKSKKLPVTIHNLGAEAADFSVSVVYNNNTGYSGDAGANGVTLVTSPSAISVEAGEEATFDAWIEAGENAQDDYYEGYLVVSGGGSEYVLPFAVQIGIPGLDEFQIYGGGLIKPIITSNRPYPEGSAVYGMSNEAWFTLIWSGNWPGGIMYLQVYDNDGNLLGYFDTYYTGVGMADPYSYDLFGGVT
ncbi:MAG: S8 family serine peptidase, partial [Clostridiales bacterium]|nr:S8 family serine peptidase [Clostridiales bacterium]